MELALFPLYTVLCPGVALPLHVFEPRYRALVDRCVTTGEPFGVVLIREGPEVGGPAARVADVGTTALIREAGRYPDGRLDIMTVGGRRFRIGGTAAAPEGYLVADVRYLDEPIGDAPAARRLAEHVSARFLRYLELLQPALDDDGPEVEVELVLDVPDAPAGSEPEPAAGGPEVIAGTDADRRELLMAAARRLVTPEDPTALSYVLAGLVQLELPSRQVLLEAPDTETRLRALDGLLTREIDLLGRQLKPLVVNREPHAFRAN